MNVDLDTWLASRFPGDGPAEVPVMPRAVRLWHAVRAASGRRMPDPSTTIGPDGEVAFEWNRGRCHLEVEVIPGGAAEWFWRDRETEEFGGVDQDDEEPIPVEVVEQMALFYPDQEARP